ncbi:MAG: amine oxidase [Ilumatobacteraceae bacterium]|nr:amine oxidase [Ilumatobacteraceae bacterium]
MTESTVVTISDERDWDRLPANEHQHPGTRQRTVVIGAGPAGLTAALLLARRGHGVEILEADATVGGISRTVVRDGWRFDIGGHRFFTKVPEVEALWRELLPDDLMLRPRLSRIFYEGKFYDYPLKAMNALRNLGVIESAKCVASYGWARVRPPKDLTTFDGWVSARFGRRLYGTFFKTYTEKVWGVPAETLPADWAAQRIKNLSLASAVINALRPRRNQKDIVSLIEEFLYPRLGPGMMWEACRDRAVELGAELQHGARVASVEHRHGAAVAVVTVDGERHECDSVVSSMPLSALVRAMDPAPPAHVLAAADGLRYRDFLTVALVVPEDAGFPDNWVYIHSPQVRLGRVQNFGSWSPYMVKPGKTCLGLEYFVNEHDELWDMDDQSLVRFAREELRRTGLIMSDVPDDEGFVVRVPKAYPVYDGAYARNVEVMRRWLEAHAANVHAVGRNGMHRYNNQDHSMLTAMLAVENIADGTAHDLWAVNVDEEYHEQSATSVAGAGAGGSGAPATAAAGTGRSAPVMV